MAREGRTISLAAGGWPSAEAPRALASGSMRWARNRSTSGRKSARPAPGRLRSSDRTRSARPGVVLGPQPVRTGSRDCDPGRDAPGADDHAPVLAVGIGRVRSRGWNIDPCNQGGIDGQRGLNFAEPGDIARERFVFLNELGLELAQGDAGQLALVLQLRKSLGPLGLVEALGRGVHQFVEPFQCGGQFAESVSLGGCELPVLAGDQLVQQAPAQVFLERLPREGRLTEPGQHGGQGGTHRLFGPAGAVQPGEGDLKPCPGQALHRTQPLVACFEVLPLGVEVGRQVAVAEGGIGVVVGEQAAADLQGLLVERLGLGVLPLGVEVVCHVVVAGWQCRGGRR